MTPEALSDHLAWLAGLSMVSLSLIYAFVACFRVRCWKRSKMEKYR